MTSFDLAYIAPETGNMLRQMLNNLMIRGRVEKARALALRIGKRIKRANRTQLMKIKRVTLIHVQYTVQRKQLNIHVGLVLQRVI